MRTLSADLLTAQQSTSGTPHLKIVFYTWDGAVDYDYSSRCIGLEHREALFKEEASITLYNNDRAVPDLTGYWVSIGYGFYTGNNVVEPDGDNAGNEYSYSPRLWVRHQQDISAEGLLVTVLELEGVWGVIRDTLINLGTGTGYVNIDTGKIFNKVYDGANTVLSIIDEIVDNVSRDSTHPIRVVWLGSQLDGIIATFTPTNFHINREPFEFASDVIYDLLKMTNCYLISKHSDDGTRPPTPATAYAYLEVRYPQGDDDVDLNLYDTQAPYFFEFERRRNVVVPNHMYLFCNKVGDEWNDLTLIMREATLRDQIAKFMDMPAFETAPDISDPTDCANLAAALLAKVPIEGQNGRVVAPHHCGIEVLDRVKVNDSRGY